MNPTIETWIESNKCEGKPAVLKLSLPEPNYPGEYYQLRLEGIRYGYVGIVAEDMDDGPYYVVHLRSGMPFCMPFLTESLAARAVFIVKRLADWRKIKIDEAFSKVKKALDEIHSYLTENYEASYLVELIEDLTPKSDEKIIEEFQYEVQAVGFGGSKPKTITKKPEPRKVINDGTWGTTICKG